MGVPAINTGKLLAMKKPLEKQFVTNAPILENRNKQKGSVTVASFVLWTYQHCRDIIRRGIN
jgi:hypothetical protein